MVQPWIEYETVLTRRVRGERMGRIGYWKHAPGPVNAYIYDHPDMAQPSECVMLVPQLTFEREI